MYCRFHLALEEYSLDGKAESISMICKSFPSQGIKKGVQHSIDWES